MIYVLQIDKMHFDSSEACILSISFFLLVCSFRCSVVGTMGVVAVNAWMDGLMGSLDSTGQGRP